MISRLTTALVTAAICTSLPSIALSQDLKEIKVSTATRLDCEFASSGFGTKAGSLPKNYDSKKQRYSLFVPKKYDAKQSWPLVLFISASDQPAGWPGWKKACVENGVFFCSAYGAGNSTAAAARSRIVLDALDDVRRQYRIDPDQTYISGFSGGGRMACAIGFALPEWFGGVVPVCGTNPIVGPTYLRHRIEERLSVAFVTGATDFNRKENEVYMFPWFEELKIRSKLWVAPKVAHAIPGPDVFSQVYDWLNEDLKRRQVDAKMRSSLAMTAGETPTAAEQASRYLDAALQNLQTPDRTWRGVALLQGIVARWKSTDAGKKASAGLNTIVQNEKLLEIIGEQGAMDEIMSVSAQARALERFGQVNGAIQAWEILVKNYPDSAAGKKALDELKRLRK